MKKFLVLLLVLFVSNSFSQVENSTRKIDIKPPKTSVNIPPVINKNPNSFTFKKIEKKNEPIKETLPKQEVQEETVNKTQTENQNSNSESKKNNG